MSSSSKNLVPSQSSSPSTWQTPHVLALEHFDELIVQSALHESVPVEPVPTTFAHVLSFVLNFVPSHGSLMGILLYVVLSIPSPQNALHALVSIVLQSLPHLSLPDLYVVGAYALHVLTPDAKVVPSQISPGSNWPLPHLGASAFFTHALTSISHVVGSHLSLPPLYDCESYFAHSSLPPKNKVPSHNSPSSILPLPHFFVTFLTHAP